MCGHLDTQVLVGSAVVVICEGHVGGGNERLAVVSWGQVVGFPADRTPAAFEAGLIGGPSPTRAAKPPTNWLSIGRPDLARAPGRGAGGTHRGPFFNFALSHDCWLQAASSQPLRGQGLGGPGSKRGGVVRWRKFDLGCDNVHL